MSKDIQPLPIDVQIAPMNADQQAVIAAQGPYGHAFYRLYVACLVARQQPPTPQTLLALNEGGLRTAGAALEAMALASVANPFPEGNGSVGHLDTILGLLNRKRQFHMYDLGSGNFTPVTVTCTGEDTYVDITRYHRVAFTALGDRRLLSVAPPVWAAVGSMLGALFEQYALAGRRMESIRPQPSSPPDLSPAARLEKYLADPFIKSDFLERLYISKIKNQNIGWRLGNP